MYQNTILNKVSCFGYGVHSGKPVHMVLSPADENYGIRFFRTDLEVNNEIIASYNNVTATKLGTTISNGYGVSVSTIEHLMAALWGCGIDNIHIEINGEEVPIMDGSSEPFVFLIECSGIIQQEARKKVIEIQKSVRVGDEQSYMAFEPADSFQVELKINFATEVIGEQNYTLADDLNSFKSDISRARTFGFLHEAEYLRTRGLAKGASLDNAIVIDNDRVLNEEGLRYNDEFVRHKVLDCVGDIYLAGAYIRGKVEGYKSGHTLNNMLLRSLFADPTAWKLVAA